MRIALAPGWKSRSAGIPVCGLTGPSSPASSTLETGDWKVAATRRLDRTRCFASRPGSAGKPVLLVRSFFS